MLGITYAPLPNKGLKYKAKKSKTLYKQVKCAEHCIDKRYEIRGRQILGYRELDMFKRGQE